MCTLYVYSVYVRMLEPSVLSSPLIYQLGIGGHTQKVQCLRKTICVHPPVLRL